MKVREMRIRKTSDLEKNNSIFCVKRVFNILFLIFLFILPTCVNAQWNQLGMDINGEAQEDYSGFSVRLSADGMTMAVGATGNGDGDEGHVRVFSYDDSNWVQLGQDIDGQGITDFSGFSLDISSDGLIIAIGAIGSDGGTSDPGYVRVFSFDGTIWSQVGEDIVGEAANDLSGASVRLSSDGNIVAVASTNNSGIEVNSGQVRVYTFDGISWNQQGEDIEGESENDYSGKGMSMSSDGSIVAIGAPFNDANGENSGHVRVFAFDGAGWIQQGNDILGVAEGDRGGESLDLSADGLTLAMGSPLNDGFANNAGHVRVFVFNGTDWVQQGQDIEGEAEGVVFPGSVSLSSDGNLLAIGIPLNSSAGEFFGQVRVYSFDGISWIQYGDDINGQGEGDLFGSTVCLNSEGTIVASGAIGNDDNGIDAGQVRAFSFGTIPSVSENTFGNNFSINPNPTKDKVTINLGDEVVTRVSVLNNLGQEMLSNHEKFSSQQVISLAGLSNGIYFVKVESDDKFKVMKVVKE